MIRYIKRNRYPTLKINKAKKMSNPQKFKLLININPNITIQAISYIKINKPINDPAKTNERKNKEIFC